MFDPDIFTIMPNCFAIYIALRLYSVIMHLFLHILIFIFCKVVTRQVDYIIALDNQNNYIV